MKSFWISLLLGPALVFGCQPSYQSVRSHSTGDTLVTVQTYRFLGEAMIAHSEAGSASAGFEFEPQNLESALFIVSGADLELTDVVIHYVDGQSFRTGQTHFFTEGLRSLVIEIPSGTRQVDGFDFVYKPPPLGSSATLELWAK